MSIEDAVGHGFRRTVLSRWWLTYLVMGVSFFVFGIGTYNIFMVLSANLEVIRTFGWQALMDGAARQFIELLVTGYLSLAAYIVFKACEYRLAHALGRNDQRLPITPSRSSSSSVESG